MSGIESTSGTFSLDCASRTSRWDGIDCRCLGWRKSATVTTAQKHQNLQPKHQKVCATSLWDMHCDTLGCVSHNNNNNNSFLHRFDMPYATGDCAGEGLCGTCLVAVEQGAKLLNRKEGVEELITQGRPLSWRASCRTIIGPNNEGGTIRIRVQPQTNMEDELNPGVKPINMKQ